MKNTKRQLPIIGILPDYSNGEENSYSTKSFYASFFIGLEWHPEYYSSSSDEKLFNEFVNKSQQFLQNKIYDYEK